MDIESLREYCLSLPHTTEDMAFGEDHVLFRVCNKIFACLALGGTDYLALKCDPDYAIELRAAHSEINPAFHWNKKYWNQVCPALMRDNEFLKSLIRHSYSEVVAKITKKIKTEFPEITEIH